LAPGLPKTGIYGWRLERSGVAIAPELSLAGHIIQIPTFRDHHIGIEKLVEVNSFLDGDCVFKTTLKA
jgi:hypothetical protein